MQDIDVKLTTYYSTPAMDCNIYRVVRFILSAFRSSAIKPKTKKSEQPIIARKISREGNLPETRENASDQVAIGFGSESDWFWF